MSRRSPFPMKDVLKLADDLERQGCTVKRKKAGVWIGFPDGVNHTTLHFTISDTRAYQNVRALVTRQTNKDGTGTLTWCLDKKR